MTNGTSKGCGELLRIGLDGYQMDYQMAIRIGDREFLDSFFDQVWGWIYPTFSHALPKDVSPYIREMIRYQQDLLNAAMQADRTTDYERLNERFEVFLHALGRYWKLNLCRWPEAEELYEGLEESYRIALIGLGGRALLIADSGRITGPSTYFNLVRGKHTNLEELANDIVRAVVCFESWKQSLWLKWEMEGAEIGEPRRATPERYPLTWFAVRLMELFKEPNQTLDLQGSARLILPWFETNSAGLAAHVRDVPPHAIEERREFATAALRVAAHQEGVEED